MKTTPLVSVVMSVYNGEKYLRESMESILSQTFTDFEFIVVDDGSIDKSKHVIASFTDKRIKYVYQENQGIVGALNVGVAAAQGRFIARMDADDIAEPARLLQQVKYLEMNPRCVAVGGNLIFIDEQGKKVLDSPLLLKDGDIKLEMLVRSPFGHPAVTFRKRQFLQAGGYSAEFKVAEDYDLWVRLARFGTFANINQTVLQYRITTSGISRSNTEAQKAQHNQVSNKAWSVIPGQLKIESFAEAIAHYPTTGKSTKLQTGRLSDVYTIVMLNALRRGRPLFAGKLLLAMISSRVGVYNLIKSIKRRVWR